MRHTSFETMQCPIARGLDRVGEWWSILILRDAFLGATRFEQFQESLGIAPSSLSRRLNSLVDAGMLERRRYSERPPRDEYVLTACGRDFRQVLWAMLAWGNRNFAPEGPSVVLVNAETGGLADPVLMDRISLRPMTAPGFRSAPGPRAKAWTHQRHAPTAPGTKPQSAAGRRQGDGHVQ
jgi:DNA-binding HxlR family transcriptional regulator